MDRAKEYWDYVLSLKIKSSATILKGPKLTYEEIKAALNGRR